MKKCEYCHTDVEGLTLFLPRKGVGKAHLYYSAIEGYMLHISGPERTRFAIKINYCPMCGRKLRGDP